VGKHRTTRNTYKYQRKVLTFEQLAKKARKNGISRSLLQNRLLGGWTPEHAVGVKMGRRRPLTRKKKRHASWKQVTCPVHFCRAKPRRGCLLPGRLKRGHPHLERKKRAAEDDVAEVPQDWEDRLEEVRQQRLDEFDRGAQIRDLVEGGMLQKHVAAELDISRTEVSEQMHGPYYSRPHSRLERVPKVWLRPPSSPGSAGDGAVAGSFQACGGGWRLGRGPREDPAHTI
jgi:hypothetical protein